MTPSGLVDNPPDGSDPDPFKNELTIETNMRLQTCALGTLGILMVDKTARKELVALDKPMRTLTTLAVRAIASLCCLPCMSYHCKTCWSV